MRNILNVTRSIDTVRDIVRDLVVVVRNVAMFADSLGRLHLSMRRPMHAEAGKPSLYKRGLQPAYAAACNAAAASRRATWAQPTSRTSTRLG